MNLDQRRTRWLRRAITQLKPILFDAGVTLPAQPLVVGIGSPSPSEAKWNGVYFEATPLFPSHIIVNRLLDDGFHILCILLHELCHFADDGNKVCHSATWRRYVRAVGLRRSKREESFFTTPIPALHHRLERVLQRLGSYPKGEA